MYWGFNLLYKQFAGAGPYLITVERPTEQIKGRELPMNCMQSTPLIGCVRFGKEIMPTSGMEKYILNIIFGKQSIGLFGFVAII
jgi:hypothetical protein